jgi:serine/threonine-protein kinase
MTDTWGLAEGDEIAPGLAAVADLGGGNLYEVWLAFDERLHTLVVAKMLRPSQLDGSSRQAMAREVGMLDRLQHPSIVRMFGHDLDAPKPYMTLEYIDGPTLSSLIRTHGALPVHQLLPLALELASALHYLGTEDAVHLDLKPSNVIMGAPAKLVDLSIAMDATTAAGIDYPLGSDEYMAPEQCVPGTHGHMGLASDVWGLGATLYRAATGVRPFHREPRWSQLYDEPMPMPPTVAPPVAAIILDCMAPDPADRPLPAEIVARIEPMMEALPTAWLSGFSLMRR